METVKDKMLTPEDVGEIVGVQGRAVREWIKKGYIAFVKLPGGHLRIKQDNFDRWLENRIVKNHKTQSV